jgi:signal peptidase I
MVMDKKTRSILLMIVGLACGMFLLRVFFIDIMSVAGRSMEPTLMPGSPLLIDKLYYGLMIPFGNHSLIQWHKPARGDIVVFFNDYDDTITVKRCLAIEGDPIKTENGQLFIYNKILPLKYYQEIKWRAYNVVPPGYIFVSGDNLNYSVDSREYGFISIKAVLGCAMFVQ